MNTSPIILSNSNGQAKLWHENTAHFNGKKTAVLGSLEAHDLPSARQMIVHAVDLARQLSCAALIGPMDGDTWHRYRAITETDGSPRFFLESPYDSYMGQAFIAEGAEVIARYVSSRTVKPARRYSPILKDRVGQADLMIRPFDISNAERDLRLMYPLCLKTFGNNFLYTPISEQEFVNLYLPLIPKLVADYIIAAEDQDGLMRGFIFAVPNYSAALPDKELIIKTYASDVKGLGGWLLDELQQNAQRQGVEMFIHALMHEKNISLKNSANYAAPFRVYELFGIELTP
jgi:hypothetical protein